MDKKKQSQNKKRHSIVGADNKQKSGKLPKYLVKTESSVKVEQDVVAFIENVAPQQASTSIVACPKKSDIDDHLKYLDDDQNMWEIKPVLESVKVEKDVEAINENVAPQYSTPTFDLNNLDESNELKPELESVTEEAIEEKFAAQPSTSSIVAFHSSSDDHYHIQSCDETVFSSNDPNKWNVQPVFELVKVEQDVEAINEQLTVSDSLDQLNNFNGTDFNSNDPNEWDVSLLTNEIIRKLITKGPVQVCDFAFPKTNNRKFSVSLYKRTLANGDQISRSWLIYSTSKNALFCFCCFLFSKNRSAQALSSTGCSDWHHIYAIVKSHENSLPHMNHFRTWKALEVGVKKNAPTIDFPMQKLLRCETKHWQEVLRRLVTFVKYLGGQCLSFCGSSDTLYELNNGNFLKLVESIVTFDPILGEHLRRINSEETQNKYLGKKLLNAIIGLVSNSIKNKISSMVKEGKYFSIILDSTPDKNHTEQVTIMIRFVYRENNTFLVKEHFVAIMEGEEGLQNVILREFETLNISISSCRGQGYDYNSNMKGEKDGLQKGIQDLERRAFLVPCCYHSLNVVVSDSVRCSLDAVKFFDILQSLYIFVSSFPNRWDIYKRKFPNLMLMSPSDTRWESRIDALRPLKNNLHDICKALIEIAELGNVEVKVTAESLADQILDFKFICCLLVWFDILGKINVVSKCLQSKAVSLNVCVTILENSKQFLIEMRTDEKFDEYINLAERMASDLEIPTTFPVKSSFWTRRRNLNETILDPKHNFKVNFYCKILNQAISCVTERMEQIKMHNNLFSFLYNISEAAKVENLKTLCSNLELALTNNKSKDLYGSELYQELLTLCPLIRTERSSLDVLNFIYSSNLELVFPNTVIAIRILNTLPITALGESSFSKLNEIKNYLRTTIAEDRLVGLAIISIEKSLFEALDYDEQIAELATLIANSAS